ncbi:MAG: hypothetical protein IPJ41_11335 [Phycisphaerales bacterium]|nr:hypothetical protein [Phycisphaerales bacterium]
MAAKLVRTDERLRFDTTHQREPGRSLDEAKGRAARLGRTGLFEALEDRKFFSLVTWDGGAGTANWNDAANWSADVLPNSSDDVQIPSGSPTPITFSGNGNAKTLLSDRALSISTGRSLNIGTSASINADLTLAGGTIAGGSWTFGGGGALQTTTSGGTIQDVILNGDLTLDATSESVLVAGTTRFNTVHLAANAASLRIAPGYTLHDDVVAEGAANGTANITIAFGGTGTVTFANDATVTLTSGTALSLNIVQSSVGTLVNQGLIAANAVGEGLQFTSLSSFDNQGTIQATAGTLTINSTSWSNSGVLTAADATLTFNGAWSNTGTVSITNATLNLDGSFTNAGLNLAGWTRSGGTVNLAGALNNAAATLTLNAATGTWRLFGGAVTGGSIAFSGGSVLDLTTSVGTLTDVNVLGDLVFDNTSEALLLAGTTRFNTAHLAANAASLRMAPGYTLHDDVVAEGAANGTANITIAYGGTGTGTFANDATVTLASGSALGLNITQSSAGTLINQGLITANASGEILQFINLTTLTNEGTIQATAGTLNVGPTSWSSSGVLTAADATLTFNGAWSNTGTVSITNATLNLDGSFTNAGLNLAGWTRSGGTVNIAGALNNAAATLTLNAATGTWRLFGGAVTGGSIAFAGGSVLDLTTSVGTLTDVNVLGDLVFDNTSEALLLAGTTRFNTAHLTANAASLRMAPGYTLHDDVVAEGASNGNANITIAYGGPGTGTFANDATVTLASGSALGLNITQSSTGTLVNQGVITANASGEILQFINLTTLTNEGTIQATAGTLTINSTSWSSSGVLTAADATLTFNGAWSNTGTVSITNATLNLDGSFTNAGLNLAGWTRSGGTVNIAGALNNAAATLTLNAATGTWRLFGGAVTGGSIAFAGGSVLDLTTSVGTLTDVNVLGDLVFDNTSEAVLLAGTTRFNTAHLTANAASLRLAPGYTLHDDVVAEGASNGTANITIAYGGPGTVTFANDATVTLASGSALGLNITQSSAGTLVNQALITANASGEILQFINLTTLTNEGTIQATAGTLNINPTTLTNVVAGVLTGGTWITASATMTANGIDITTNNATIEVRGLGSWASLNNLAANGGSFTLEDGKDFSVPGSFSNTGTLILGPGSTLTVNGDFAQSAAGSIEVRASGSSALTGYGNVSATGAASINGAYTAVFVGGYAPTQGTFFDVVTGASGRTGTFSSVSLPTPPSGDKILLIYEGTRVRMLSTDLADLDLNGSVNTQDFIIYLNWFASNDSRADFNHDGNVNTLDFIVYLNLWADG